MSLANIDLEGIAEELRIAARTELPKIDALRQRIRRLRVEELGYRQCHAVAPVATDGGENRLSLAPLDVELIRVADSEGKEHLQKVIALGGDPAQIQHCFREEPLLKTFLDRLGVSYRDLSHFLPGSKRRLHDAEAALGQADEDLRKFVRSFRDIAEWAVLLELAHSAPRVRVLVIRDGLLRSKHLTEAAVQAMGEAFERAYHESGALLVGVAKRSQALSYLSLALTLERVFHRSPPCCLEVPEELERECYRFASPWMQGHGFGRLHLAKLADGKDTPVFPVDIPRWLIPARRKETLEYLAETTGASFPTPGYPQPLMRAHENANLRGLEMSVLGSLLSKALVSQMGDHDSEQVLRYIEIGRNLCLGGVQGNG
jgi:hypothetical protein